MTYYYRVRAVGTGGVTSPYSPEATPAGDGLSATFWNNVDFTGNTVTRQDPTVDFHWKALHSPAAGIDPATFAAQWDGQVLAPTTGTYRFTAQSDDGARVWVNNQLVLNHWDGQGASVASGVIDLVANTKYDIRVEYFQDDDAGDMHLSWVVPGAASGTNAVAIPTANLFSRPGGHAPAAPAAVTDVSAAAPFSTGIAAAPQVDVSWSAVDGAEAYLVYRLADGATDWSVAGSVLAGQGNQFSDVNAILDTAAHYRYRVIAVGAGGRAEPAEALAPVTNVQATRSGDGVVISWDGNSTSSSARVERSDDGGATWLVVVANLTGVTSVLDDSPAATDTSVWRVTALGAMIAGEPAENGAPVGAAPGAVSAVFYSTPDLSGASTTATLDSFDRNWATDPRLPSQPPTTDGFSAVLSSTFNAASAGMYSFTAKANGGVRLYVDDQLVLSHWEDVPYLTADATRDGAVDFADLVRLAQHYNGPGDLDDGDFTGVNGHADGLVDFNDLVKLAQQYNTAEQDVTTAGSIKLATGSHAIKVQYFNLHTLATLHVLWTPPNTTAPVPPVLTGPAAPPQLTKPAAPEGVRAIGSAGIRGGTVDGNVVQITWRDRSDNETGFEIEAEELAGTEGNTVVGDPIVLGSVGPGVTRFLAEGLKTKVRTQIGVRYQFAVRAVNGTDAAHQSDWVRAITTGVVDTSSTHVTVITTGSEASAAGFWRVTLPNGGAFIKDDDTKDDHSGELYVKNDGYVYADSWQDAVMQALAGTYTDTVWSGGPEDLVGNVYNYDFPDSGAFDLQENYEGSSYAVVVEDRWGAPNHGDEDYNDAYVAVCVEQVDDPPPNFGDQIGTEANQRVDIHGVPLPDPSPAGEGESDRIPNTASIDMYHLTPSFSTTDVAVPMPGDELLMEFRRTLGVGSHITHLDPNAALANVQWATENLLGPGWSTNIGSRVTVYHDPNARKGEPAFRATVYDEVGNAAAYWSNTDGGYLPDVRSNFSNVSLRAGLVRGALYDGHVYDFMYAKAHGTRLYYTLVTTINRATGANAPTETYFRLDRVVDRNGNELRYYYPSTGAVLPAAVYDPSLGTQETSPRRIDFTYTQIGTEIRLDSVTGPAVEVGAPASDRRFNYHYDAAGQLESVERPAVADGDDTLAQRPATHFTYDSISLPRAVVRSSGVNERGTKEEITWTLPRTITNAYVDEADPRKTTTLFDWGPDGDNDPATPTPVVFRLTPTAIQSQNDRPVLLWEDKPRIYRVTTLDAQNLPIDGSAVFDEKARSHATATTTVTDTRGIETEYQFGSGTWDQIVPAPNDLGFAVVVDQIIRSEPVTDADGDTQTDTVTYKYSRDINRNLTDVIDVSGNTAHFDYGPAGGVGADPYSAAPYGSYYGTYYQLYNEPSSSILDYGPAEQGHLNLTTLYKHETKYNKLTDQTDPQGTTTHYEFDPNGNRTHVIEAYQTDVAADTQYDYDPTGFVTKVTDPDQRVTEFRKDPDTGHLEYTIVEGRADQNEDLTPLQSPANVTAPYPDVDPQMRWLVTHRVSDIMDRTREETDGLGYLTSYAYDNWDRVTSMTAPAVASADWDPLSGTTPSLTTQPVLKYYDFNSNLVKEVDAEGNVTVNYYDRMNRLTETRRRQDPAQNQDGLDTYTDTTYNAVGLPERQTDALGRMTIYDYDALLRPIRTTLPAVTEVEDPSSTSPTPETQQVTYTTKTYYGPNAGSGAFTFGGFNPTRVVDALGHAADTKYDAAYRAVQSVRRIETGSALTALASDASAQAGEAATLTQYDAAHNPIKITTLNEDRNGTAANRVTYTFYDQRHRATVTLLDLDGDDVLTPGQTVDDAAAFAGGDADDLITRTTYDGRGNVTKVTDPMGRSTLSTYDGASRKTLVTMPAVDIYIPGTGPGTGTITGVTPTNRTVYDADSNPVIAIDANGDRTWTQYDARNRAVFTALDLDGDGHFEVQPTNGWVSATAIAFDPDGNGTNAGGREPAPTPPPGTPAQTDVVRLTGYNFNNQAVYAIDSNGNRTDTHYDFAGRPDTVTGAAATDAENGDAMIRPQTLTEYDQTGKVVKVTDPRGIVTRTEYDELGRPRFVYANADAATGAPDRMVTETRYDGDGNPVALVLHNWKDDGGPEGWHEVPQVTTYGYDNLGRRVTETLPGIGDGNNRVTTTAYDRVGDAITLTDPKGHIVETDYDRAGRVHEQRFRSETPLHAVEETRTSTYDKAGNLLSRTDANGVSGATYDALNRSLTETRTNSVDSGIADDYTIKSSYDRAGNRTKLVYPDVDGVADGRTLITSYDHAGRAVQIDDTPTATAPVQTTTFGYDLAGNRTSEALPNGTLTNTTFDAQNRVATITATEDGGAGDVIYELAYRYDRAGQRRFATETLIGQPAERELAWDYDNLYRLTGESWAGPQAQARTYSYDPAGNRLSRTIDQTSSGGSVTTTTNAYNDLNELVTSTTGAVATAYTYDLDGNRTRKETPGQTAMNYVFDTSDRLIEVDAGATPIFTAKYDARTRRLSKTESGTNTTFRYDGGTNFQELQGAQIMTELVRAGGLGGGIGSVLYTDKSMAPTPGPVETFVYDALGNTVALTDDAGTPTQTNLYEAFGGTVVTTGTSTNNRLHNTKERDASIGLDNHGFRYYDADAGSYIQRDPSGYDDGMNVYMSVHDNPINGVDPLGLADRADDYRFQKNPSCLVCHNPDYLTGHFEGISLQSRIDMDRWASGSYMSREAKAAIAEDAHIVGNFVVNVGAGVGETLTPATPGGPRGYAGYAGRVLGRGIGGAIAAIEIATGATIDGVSVLAEPETLGLSTAGVVAGNAVMAHGAWAFSNATKPVDFKPDNAAFMAENGEGTGAGASPEGQIHSRYADGTPVYEGQQPGRITGPDPEAGGSPHTVLQNDLNNGRIYKAREYGEGGKRIRDIDFTGDTFPNGRPRPGPNGNAPHQHVYTENIEGNPRSGEKRGPAEPLED